MTVKHNDNLQSLTGLDNLDSIGEFLTIDTNASLLNCSGLGSLTSLGGKLVIFANESLTSLTGMDNLSSINGYIYILYNIALTSLDGIQNIDPMSVESQSTVNYDLEIKYNPMLSECEVESICGVLSIPTKTTDIQENASGCNNTAEIEDACLSSISEYKGLTSIKVSPNPATQGIYVSSEIGKIDKIWMANHLGQKVLETQENPLMFRSFQPVLFLEY